MEPKNCTESTRPQGDANPFNTLTVIIYEGVRMYKEQKPGPIRSTRKFSECKTKMTSL
jgi:hypothetical protein